MDPIALLAVGGGVWWLSRKMAAPVQSSVPAPAERRVIVEREAATGADDPEQMGEDLEAWALRAMGNGGGDFYTAAMPPLPYYQVIYRGRRSCGVAGGSCLVPGVIDAAPMMQAPSAMIRRVTDAFTRAGVRYRRSRWGLPDSWLAVQLGPEPGELNRGRPPGSFKSLIEQLPGQVAGGVPMAPQGVARVRGLVSRGALWTVARSSRGFWWVADAASSRAGAPDLVIEYLVSTLGRAAVVLGQPVTGQANRRTIVGQLAPDAWTPVVVDSTGRPSASVVLPRSDFYPYDGRGPARSPWIGQALREFLSLPVVTLPGLRVYNAETANRTITRKRMYDGKLWSSPEWRALRSKLNSGENFAQLANGRRAYP